MSSETGEMWTVYRKEQRARRDKRLAERLPAVLALRAEGFDVKELTDYQFRINGQVDVYPVHNRWHILQTGLRGSCRDLPIFLREFFKSDQVGR